MRYQGTNTTLTGPTEFVNDVTNVGCITLQSTVDGPYNLFRSGVEGGTATAVNSLSPRNFIALAALYTSYRMISIKYRITFTNQNDDQWFRGYWFINTSTERNKPIALMSGTTAKEGPIGGSAPWINVNGVTKILDDAREIKKFTIPNAQTHNGRKTINITIPASAFLRDRYGVHVLGGRFNTDGTGPGAAMSTAVANRTTTFGLEPQLHIFYTPSDKIHTGAVFMESIEIKKTIEVEFFNRIMNIAV